MFFVGVIFVQRSNLGTEDRTAGIRGTKIKADKMAQRGVVHAFRSEAFEFGGNTFLVNASQYRDDYLIVIRKLSSKSPVRF